MKKYLLFGFISFVILIINAQIAPPIEQKPYIEVSGSAEMEIIPDEIYISVLLQERYDGKDRISLENMEQDMFNRLKSIGIDSKNISLSDAGSNFIYRKRQEDDALLSRNYSIKVNDAATVIKVYDELGKIDAQDAFISNVSHSKIEDYRMQTKVQATLASKDKATKMLSAIGEEIGKPVLIQEREFYIYPYEQQYSQFSNMAMESSPQFDAEPSTGTPNNLTYQKIKLRYEVFAKYEIK